MSEAYALLILDIDTLITALKTYKAAVIKRGKLSDKSFNMDWQHNTKKQIESAQVNLNWHCMDMSKQERGLHALAVNLGISPLRTKSEYLPMEFNPSAWHKYQYQPPMPRGYSMEYFEVSK